MPSLIKFNAFVEQLAKGQHDLSADTLKLFLTNSTPNVATNTVKSDLTEVTPVSGYSAGGPTLTVTSVTQTGGVLKVVCSALADIVPAAAFGPFRYAVVYNASKSDKLIGYWDYGRSMTLQASQPLSIVLNGTTGILNMS